MRFSRYALSGLILAGAIFTAHESKAGFDVIFDEGAMTVKSETSASGPMPDSILAPVTSPADAEKKYNISKGIDPASPALKVYQETYVPDSVRQKYTSGKDTSESSAGQMAPMDLTNTLTGQSADQPADQPADQMPPQAPPTELFPAPPSTGLSASPASEQLVIIPKPGAVHKVDSWRARKGENVRDVLRRWSKRENVDLMWASASVPVLENEYSYVGSFQDAVAGLLKQTGMNDLHSQYRSEGMDPVLMSPASTITTNSAPLVEPQEQQPVMGLGTIFKPEKSATSGPETRWFGLSGAPLREVLQVWAEDAGVSLVWQAESNYALKESISRTGHFEDVVYSALSQYDNDAVRPVGEMYKDQATGQKVLVIRTDASAL